MAMDKVLSSYYTLGLHASSLASSTSLRDAHDLLHWFLLDMPVVPGLLGFHALFAAERVHALTKGQQFWFKSYVLTIFAAFGGSTLAAIFSGAPAPLFTHASNYMLGFITVAWYLVDQSRVLRAVLRTRPVNAVLTFGATAAKARAIFSFIDAFIVKYPGAMAGAIALGGVSGSGGQLFVSLEKKARRGFHTPSELSSPGWGFKSAYLVALAYYVATDPEGILSELPIPVKYSAARDTARYVLSLGLCSHAALETLLARNLNPTYVLDRLFYAVTRVRQDAAPEFSSLEAATASQGNAGNSMASAGNGGKHGGVNSTLKDGSPGLRKRGKR
jgi:TRIC channel